MSTQQAKSELAIFRLFAETSGLSVVPGSIESRAPREPDIRCVIADSGPHCFELVEVIDSDLAKAVGIQFKFQSRLKDGATTHQIKGFSDALVFVDFATPSTNNQKQQACDSLVEVLGQLPTGVHGNIDPARYAGLAGLVRKLRITRGDFVGPAFQVGGGVFLSDPINECLQEKFKKKYTTDVAVDLLAYYQMHPTYRAEYELPGVSDYVRGNLAASPFSRVWVFDAENRKILYQS